jgi:hypothetical protein
VADSFDDIACTSFSLGANKSSTLRNAPQRFSKIASATNERNFEPVFIDVVFVIRRRQNFGLIYIINPDSLQNLCL